jgi:hypothetical protein
MPLFTAVEPLPVNRIKNRLFDPDARDYILRVEAADGDRLESSVRSAINDFVLGCKADGIWTSIKASCIMAGARTVAGAITPLAGNAPISYNFVSGDYSRQLGLLGDGSSKFLNTQYNSATFFQQNNNHISVYVTSAPSSSTTAKTFIGNIANPAPRMILTKGLANEFGVKLSSSATTSIASDGITNGFKGGARNGSNTAIGRTSQSNTSIATTASQITGTQPMGVFATGSGTIFLDARMSFYSMGTYLDLSLLDTRVTTLMNTLASVLP